MGANLSRVAQYEMGGLHQRWKNEIWLFGFLGQGGLYHLTLNYKHHEVSPNLEGGVRIPQEAAEGATANGKPVLPWKRASRGQNVPAKARAAGS